ncbi:efflux RND transporter periplasmic adaptor subunit [Halarcobacter bivalviorum]|uniref:Efflux transporter periplasmic adaptor subunit n=1 Tax=Halarcobacter bivalviorum TaxID=663364 RepID=A0AAX2AAF2_9BACT|nr:efflux RND transporter periplasmic adaptor subunit [Halarcobacter bivalviorum]AXH12495.1 RND family efflux system, membrane fusion protein [Halarcobacter bivalviorum]RXK10582.1 efflux transporter periplasmic adaptor subunit [Halarcobacter bivalviorum]
MKKILILTILLIINLQAMEISGTVISDNEKIISSKFMGLIKKVYVKEGDFVKKGDSLYSIDSSNIDSLKKEALYNKEMLENSLANIKLNYERYKRLYEKDLVAKYELEQLKLQLDNTKNLLNIAKAKIKEVNTQYEYLNIKASNNGLIIKKSIKEGEIAIPSMPALILTDLDSLKIKTSIPESALQRVKIGTKVKVFIESLAFQTEGKITSIIPDTQSMTHSFIVKIDFDKQDKKLYPGMYAKLFLEFVNE